jgi:hypothetical protein
MQKGEIQANLVILNDDAKLDYIPDLIDRKVNGTEAQSLDDADLRFHEGEFTRLMGLLESAGDESTLPEEAAARPGLESLLIRLRLKHLGAPNAD